MDLDKLSQCSVSKLVLVIRNMFCRCKEPRQNILFRLWDMLNENYSHFAFSYVLFQKKFKLEERINADLIDRALGTLISFYW